METEKRLIDVNALPSGWMLAKFTEYNGKMRLIRTMPLSACPTVDAVEVVHARWLDNELAFAEKCSVCGKGVYWDVDGNYHRYPYCPYCGAKMDGGKDDGC